MEPNTYTEVNGYLIPNIVIPEDELGVKTSLEMWGRRRLRYLEEHRPILYTNWLLSGKLMGHLHEVDITARERQVLLIKQLMKSEGITEQLKADDQMRWVGRVNNIRNRVEEIILAELICC